MPQETSKIEALLWLRDFLCFFQDDFLQWQSEEEAYKISKKPTERVDESNRFSIEEEEKNGSMVMD